MIVLGYRFEPKLWVVLVTAVSVIIFIELGKWQLSRADEKKARHELLEQYAKPLIMPTADNYQEIF